MRRKVFALLPLIIVSFFTLSCSQKDASSLSPAVSNTSYAANVRVRDFAPGQLQAHYLKHRYQFGNITQGQYLAGARNLLNAPKDKDILEKIRPNGDILHYRVSTGEFAAMASTGRIRTYFKADYKYWIRQ